MIFSILCGGSGSRLFPLSRQSLPKQFAKLLGDTSLFRLTLTRSARLAARLGARIQVLTNEAHYFLVLDEAKEANATIDSLILESTPKNTAAALVIAALIASKQNLDEIMLSLPSDHLIDGDQAYTQAVEEAVGLAKKGFLVVFGIAPRSPHTGYGYIEVGAREGDGWLVDRFHEKPSLQLATSYMESKKHYWNSGLFCYTARTLLEEAKALALGLYEACLGVLSMRDPLLDSTAALEDEVRESNSLYRLDRGLSQALPNLSIDYAVMEKSKRLVMVKGAFSWNDVGCFDSLEGHWASLWPKDSNDNISQGAIEALNSKNNLIVANKLVATIGLNDFIVIDTPDALLLAKRGESQRVRQIVEALSLKNSPLVKEHSQVFRPWGSYTVLLEAKGYKLKRILVKPKQRLSLQRHHHRNEHWIVVSGSALVQIGESENFLAPNQSTYIPMGRAHRLSNPGNIDLVMIEVQVGEYLGEDDIVRLEDDYSR